MDKKRIAVFDFRAKDCIHTAEAIRQYYADQGVSAEVVEFTATSAFAYDFKANDDADTPYDMTFIGVDNIMGMETARSIRDLDTWRPMFLVSEVSDYGLEGFRLHALDYLTKPVSPQRIGQAVERIKVNA
jgi:DNA-binding LytR/AlgR family response regulator